jgi:two-component system, NarL family, nitrate/nitrite response regulator NarL
MPDAQHYWGRTNMDYYGDTNKLRLSFSQDQVQPIKTVLICQSTLFRSGISHFLSGTRFVVSGDALDDVSELSEHSDNDPVLFIICESRSADEHVTVIQSLKSERPSARVVLLADQLDIKAGIQLCEAGLDGLCSTAMGRLSLIHVLEFVMLGEVFIPGSAVIEMLEQMRSEELTSIGAPASVRAANDVFTMSHRLSDRETEILRLLTQGASNKHIAQLLGLTEQTVKVHLKAILRKVNAANRTQAAVWALKHLSTTTFDRMLDATE